MTLSAPEMTVLVGGMRALDANTDQASHGVLTDRPERSATISSSTRWIWAPSGSPHRQLKMFEGRDVSGGLKWTGTRVDLVFGSNSQLRGLAEVYAGAGGDARFVGDFVSAWTGDEPRQFDVA